MRKRGAPDAVNLVPSVWVILWLASMAAGLPAMAAGAAAGLAAHGFLDLWRKNDARSRLQCGLSMPLLLLTGGGAVAVAGWLAMAALAASFREQGWTNRAASMFTVLFPALLLAASRTYLSWLGLRLPFP